MIEWKKGLRKEGFENMNRTFEVDDKTNDVDNSWASEWLDAVADGSNTMSQRKLTSIERRGGGLEAVKALAQQKGVHLLLIEDDKGNELVAASVKPFTVVC